MLRVFIRVLGCLAPRVLYGSLIVDGRCCRLMILKVVCTILRSRYWLSVEGFAG